MINPVKGVYEKHPGTDIWWIRYSRQGKRVTESIGRRSDAIAAYQQRMTEIRTGRQIAVGRVSRGVKFGELADDAINYAEAEKHKDLRNLEQRIAAVKAYFGNQAASSIKPSDIRDWLLRMTQERTWSSATWNRYKSAISLAFKVGLQDGKVQTNPARFVAHKKEPAGRLRYLLPEEEIRLRAVLVSRRPHCLPQRDIALHTGMRKGEQFTVDWSQVDFKNRVIHLYKTKNGDDRDVPLNEVAYQTLVTLRAEHKHRAFPFTELFFDRRGNAIKDSREWFSASYKEAGIHGLAWLAAHFRVPLSRGSGRSQDISGTARTSNSCNGCSIYPFKPESSQRGYKQACPQTLAFILGHSAGRRATNRSGRGSRALFFLRFVIREHVVPELVPYLFGSLLISKIATCIGK